MKHILLHISGSWPIRVWLLHPWAASLCMSAYYYSLLHLECHSVVIANLNLLGLFSTEHGKRDLENQNLIEIWDRRNGTPNVIGSTTAANEPWYCKYPHDQARYGNRIYVRLMDQDISRFAVASPDSPRVFRFSDYVLGGHGLFTGQNITGLMCTGGVCFP